MPVSGIKIFFYFFIEFYWVYKFHGLKQPASGGKHGLVGKRPDKSEDNCVGKSSHGLASAGRKRENDTGCQDKE
jgi:hypothetical protein